MKAPPDQTHPDANALRAHLSKLKLPFMLENHQALAKTAADKHWSHVDYLLESALSRSNNFPILDDASGCDVSLSRAVRHVSLFDTGLGSARMFA